MGIYLFQVMVDSHSCAVGEPVHWACRSVVEPEFIEVFAGGDAAMPLS